MGWQVAAKEVESPAFEVFTRLAKNRRSAVVTLLLLRAHNSMRVE